MNAMEVCQWIVIAMEFSMIVVAHLCFTQTRRLNRRRQALIARWEEITDNLKKGNAGNEITKV